LLYRSGQTSGKTIIQWMKGDGKTEALWEEPAYYSYPRLSPDGSRLVYAVVEGPNTVIWVYDARRGGKTRLTAGPGVNLFPIWSPDGQYVVFQSAGELYWARSDGAQSPRPLATSARRGFPTSFTPDGKILLYYELKPSGGSLIQSVPLENQSGTLRAGEPTLFRELGRGRGVRRSSSALS
jgi:Tol biopolymer transport system component